MLESGGREGFGIGDEGTTSGLFTCYKCIIFACKTIVMNNKKNGPFERIDNGVIGEEEYFDEG